MDISKLFNKYDDTAGDLYQVKKQLLLSDRGLRIIVPATDLRKIEIIKNVKGNVDHLILNYSRGFLSSYHISKRFTQTNHFIRNNCEDVLCFEGETFTREYIFQNLDKTDTFTVNSELIETGNGAKYITLVPKTDKIECIEHINKLIEVISKNYNLICISKMKSVSEERTSLERSSKIGLSSDYFGHVCVSEIRKTLTAELEGYNKTLLNRSKYNSGSVDYIETNFKVKSNYFFGKDSYTLEDVESISLSEVLERHKHRKIEPFIKEMRRMKISFLQSTKKPNIRNQLKFYTEELKLAMESNTDNKEQSV